MLTQVLTPAIYRTTITHSRLAPVHHSFEYRSYSWYVDVDDLPRLPWWLRPFARFHADDHFADPPHGSLRDRLSAFFADHAMAVPEGRITALLQARVFGYVFNPLSIFWCHDRDGQLRHVIAEVHNTYGERHAYLLPPTDLPVVTAGTPFQRAVWAALRQIPVGTTLSYGALAERIGRKAAVRAVGAANGANPVAVVVPCHRVIGADGSLSGYGGGLERKRWLLAHEGALPKRLAAAAA